jgi:hypothetical protein
MVKSGSYEVKQPSIFGRIGQNLGKNLAEQLPKAVEQERMAAGLNQFAQQSTNPLLQQYAQLLSIPGITPQAIQTFGELVKQQNLSNAYRNSANRSTREEALPSFQSSLQNAQFGQLPGQVSRQNFAQEEFQPIPEQRTPPVPRTEFGQPQIVGENPLNEEFLTKTPWTPQKRDAVIRDYIDQGFTPDQAKDLQVDDEARDLGQAPALKQRYEELKGRREEAKGELLSQLETKLQKKGEKLFEDITGDMLLNAQRGMERDLRLNPNASVQDVANDWSNRLKALAQTKVKLNTDATKTNIGTFFKGTSTFNSLKEYQKIFDKADDLDEYYNILKQNNSPAVIDANGNEIKPATTGFGLSSFGAASIAYPLNSNLQNLTSNTKRFPLIKTNERETYARQLALEVLKNLTPKDSIFSIIKNLMDNNSSFDSQSFIDEIRENRDQLRNARQKDEIANPFNDFSPSWGDIFVLPFYRRK